MFFIYSIRVYSFDSPENSYEQSWKDRIGNFSRAHRKGDFMVNQDKQKKIVIMMCISGSKTFKAKTTSCMAHTRTVYTIHCIVKKRSGNAFPCSKRINRIQYNKKGKKIETRERKKIKINKITRIIYYLYGCKYMCEPTILRALWFWCVCNERDLDAHIWC